jgi:hypothetical protein
MVDFLYHPYALTGNGTPRTKLKMINIEPVSTADQTRAQYQLKPLENMGYRSSMLETEKPTYGTVITKAPYPPMQANTFFKPIPWGKIGSELGLLFLTATTRLKMQRTIIIPLAHSGRNPHPGPNSLLYGRNSAFPKITPPTRIKKQLR